MLIRGVEYKNKSIQSFSLIELLITIAILAIIAGSIVVVISPGELLAQARDSNRMAELNSLNKAITMHSNSVGGFRGAPDIVYISIPSNLTNCSDLSLPTLPAGWSYRCVTTANLRRVDGLGWIPINFNAMPGGSPFHQLPIDPVNSAADTLYFAYTRGSGGYAAVALLQSVRHGRSALQDGGSDAGRYEVGTDLSLWSRASGLVGYWPFTGVGTITNNQTIGMEDASGNNNHGRASNANATGMTFTTGQVRQAISFDGVDDFVEVTHSLSSPITISGWVRLTDFGKTQNTFFDVSPHNVLTISLNRTGIGNTHVFIGNSTVWLGTPSIISSTNLTLNQWHYIAFTCDGIVSRLFHDGRLVGSSPHIPSNFGTFYRLGRLAHPAVEAFRGSLDEVRIYNRALSASEVRANFNAGR